MRTWFALMSSILWTGIFFSGFANVNWVVYAPAAGFLFAAVTGICPSLSFLVKLFEIRLKETSNK